MDKAQITVAAVDSENVVFTIEALDPSILDKDATFQLVRTVEVKDSRPINDSMIIYQCAVEWDGPRAQIPVSMSGHQIYTYRGLEIDMTVDARLHIDDGVLTGTTLEYDYNLSMGDKPEAEPRSEFLHEPHDEHGFVGNLMALPKSLQIQIGIAFALVALAFAGLLLTVVILRLFPQAYLSFGLEFPIMPLMLFAGLVLTGFFAAWGWAKKKMRGYMVFRPGPKFTQPILRDKPIRVSDLIDGRAQIDVDQLTLRIVAVNIERGQYRRGSGTRKRTVSFHKPVRGVVIYNKTLTDIRKGQTLSECLDGEVVDFENMFETLYPPKGVSHTHGLSIAWEIQVLHPVFVDREFRGRSDLFEYRHFLPGWESHDLPDATVQ